MIGRYCRTAVVIFLAALMALAPGAPVFAQQQGAAPPPSAPPAAETQPGARTIQVSNQDFTHGKPWFPHVIAPYKPTPVPEPVLTNAPRLEQMVQNGKLTISLED